MSWDSRMRMAEVAFADYLHDTREIADRAAAIIADQRREIETLQRDRTALVMALVEAAGGTVTISDFDLQQIPEGKVLEVEYRAADAARIFRIVPAKPFVGV